MTGNKGKSRKGSRGGNLGVRVGGRVGGKRLLEERGVRVIEGKVVMSEKKEKG